MTSFAARKLRVYSALAAVLLVGSLVARRPEIAALALPFLFCLAAGLARADARPAAAATCDRDKVVEGERVRLGFALSAPAAIDSLQLAPLLPAGLELEGKPRVEIALGDGERRTLSFDVRCRRWGSYELGEALLRAGDRYGLLGHEGHVAPALSLRVYPAPARLRRLLAPRRTPPLSGNVVARRAGQGIEFADLRPYQPGDAARDVNWRASARRGQLWVSQRHPEDTSDVIIFVDAFDDVRDERGSTLESAVRAAATIADAYLAGRNRVGFVSFGGTLRWLNPGTGMVHRYQIVEALLASRSTFSYAWKGADVIPRRTLPPQSLIIALSPLLDARSIAALLDLRRRGYDVAIIEISPVPYARPPKGELGEMAVSLWSLDRELLRARYRRHGVAVGRLERDGSVAAALEEVRRFRHVARTLHGR